VPLSGTVCGDPVALSTMVTVPLRAPVAVGVKVTLSVQDDETPRDPPQFVAGTVVTAKSPLMVTLVMVNVAVPILVSVTGMTELVVPKS
jgi:hypothetical protein